MAWYLGTDFSICALNSWSDMPSGIGKLTMTVTMVPYMDASRSASCLTLMMAEDGCCGLISGLQCKALCLAGLDGLRNRHLVSCASSKLKEPYRFESIPGHPV